MLPLISIYEFDTREPVAWRRYWIVHRACSGFIGPTLNAGLELCSDWMVVSEIRHELRLLVRKREKAQDDANKGVKSKSSTQLMAFPLTVFHPI